MTFSFGFSGFGPDLYASQLCKLFSSSETDGFMSVLSLIVVLLS